MNSVAAVVTVHEKRLMLAVGGELRPLSTRSIFSLMRGDVAVAAELGVSQALSEMAPGVAFMSRPLAVFAWVRNLDKASITIDLAVSVDGQPRALLSRDDDHLLVEMAWYPLEAGSFSAAVDWLGAHAPDGALPPSRYADLYRGLDASVEIRDEVDLDRVRAALVPAGAPGQLLATLYPYQETGYHWLSATAEAGLGCILADEMGLGKTLQVIAVIEERRVRGLRPSLVIAPVTLMRNWYRELARFAPQVRAYIHQGPSRARYAGALDQVDVVLTSYETAVNDLGLLVMVDWDLLVVDEAQNVKNPDTNRARLLRQIPRRAAIMVTGTPLENRTLDIWSLADFAVSGYLGDRQTFTAGLENEPELLARAVRPLMIRREVADVASDLPERVDIDVQLEMFEGEMADYTALVQAARSAFNREQALAILTRLRQFCAHPTLIDGGTTGDPTVVSAKMTRLVELLEEIFASGEKVLIFSAYRDLSDMILRVVRERLHAGGWLMDGRTPPASRQELIDEFSAFEGAAALVLHPATGGTGLNITAANHVIHYTLEWNPAKEAQATARVFRRGQTLPVFVYRLMYVDTIDEVIDGTLRRKRDLAEDVVQVSERLDLEVVMQALRLPMFAME